MKNTETPLLKPPTDAEIVAAREAMWGYIGDERCGWKTCQYIREGRLFLTQAEWEGLCRERALPGEKYCEGHMPNIPNRVVWFAFGAAAMWLLLRFIH